MRKHVKFKHRNDDSFLHPKQFLFCIENQDEMRIPFSAY